jgi:hypothetical protein
LALIVLLPMARLLPLTVSVAVEPETVADPRVVLPTMKVTLPVSAVLPLAGFTVAVKTVLAEDAMLAGFAATVVVVATGGVVTATVTDPLELEKLPLAV